MEAPDGESAARREQARALRRRVVLRRRAVALACLLALVATAAAGALVARGGSPSRRDAGVATSTTTTAAPDTSTTALTPPPPPQPTRIQAAFSAAAAAGRPPQFIVASFDGAADLRRYERWRRVAREAGAHFTFFVSGVYLLDPARKQLYDAPRRGRGESDIGFANGAGPAEPRQNVIDVLGQIRQAAAEGHEFGTHFGGHFCGERGVSTWNAADWASEIDQSRALLVHASENNELEPPLPVPFAESDIVGDRTPCLEGKLDVLYPVLRAKGFRYDASRASPPGAWPARMDGLWSFPLPLIHLVGHRYSVLAMDYNMFVNQSDGVSAGVRKSRRYERFALASYRHYFRSMYTGARAPISIGNHFAGWNHGAYENALEHFLLAACAKPEVACVSYRELADWLDALPPEMLQQYRAGRFEHAKRLPA